MGSIFTNPTVLTLALAVFDLGLVFWTLNHKPARNPNHNTEPDYIDADYVQIGQEGKVKK